MALALGLLWAAPATAQIRVHPTGVNVNSQGATTVFLTFGGLNGYQSIEALWCSRLLPAAPDVGQRCDPSTILGSLPLRYDQSTLGTGSLTDIMSIPPSVVRRAYQAAEAGGDAGFFYVRRFTNAGGGPDQYVAVTCRMAGGGARVPFSLLDVEMGFDVEAPVLYVRNGDRPPAVRARIAYNGTGRLRGRWEVVMPGEELPSSRDLLTEATLPFEERGTQRRYTEIGRFNVFLPPSSRPFVLPGPDPRRLPTSAEGFYYVLLRIEASDDKEGDSNLASAGAGQGVVNTGAVAGFPLPTIRYVVGGERTTTLDGGAPGDLRLLAPVDEAVVLSGDLDLAWLELPQADVYRVEMADQAGQVLLSALVQRGVSAYRAPPFLKERAPGGQVRWRVVAIDVTGRELRSSVWRRLRVE
ncbi:MAG: hypothetical protein IT177_04990 [Acidobacteria bacterium]|nr:hypothetical protein [Acidobacteriota bacterium]